MSDRRTFALLLAKLRGGDPAAASQLVDEYGRRLAALVRARLDARIRRKEDPEEIVQSVFKSFFRRFADGQFRLDNRHDLWALLVTITLRKCGHRVEHYTALCRDIRRDMPLSEESLQGSWHVLARGPTPEEAALLSETVERLMTGLAEHQQRIVALSLDGATVPQIAAALNLTQRTIQRVMRGVRERLERWQLD